MLIDRWERAGAAFCEVWVTPETNKPEELGAGGPEQVGGTWARRAMFPWLVGDAAWPEEGAIQTRFVECRGWPLPALWCAYQVEWETAEGAVGDVVGGYRFKGERVLKGSSKAIRFDRAFPLRPLALGLVADVAIFGLAWYGVLWVATSGTARMGWRERPNVAEATSAVVPLAGAGGVKATAGAKGGRVTAWPR